MAKRLVKQYGDVKIYRYSSGIAVAESDKGEYGCCHPGIHNTGSVAGMRNLGYWGKNDTVVSAGDYVYNTSIRAVSNPLDRAAEKHCNCGGNHNRVTTLMSLSEIFELK